MSNKGMVCGECVHARRYWGTLRCVRTAPRDERGAISRAAVTGSPYCEGERSAGALTARLTGVCGRDGRFWVANADVAVASATPRRIFLALVETGGGRVTGYAFSSRAERDAQVSRLSADGLYAAVDAEILDAVP